MNPRLVASVVALVFLAGSALAEPNPAPGNLDNVQTVKAPDGPLPNADIELAGVIQKVADQWVLQLTGTVNNVVVGGDYPVDPSDPQHRCWSGLEPFDAIDEKYEISVQYNDSVIFDALQGLDIPVEGGDDIVFPENSAPEEFEIDIDFCVGPDCERVGGGFGDSLGEGITLESFQTSAAVSGKPATFRNRTTGETLTHVEFLHKLAVDYGFTPEQTMRMWLGGTPLSKTELQQALVDGAQRKLASLIGNATPGMTKDVAYALAEAVWQASAACANDDVPAFLAEAEKIMRASGADDDTVSKLLSGLDEVGNPLNTMQQSRQGINPLDREVTITLEAEIELQVTIGVATAIVRVKASVTGSESDAARLQQLAIDLARNTAEQLVGEMKTLCRKLKDVAKSVSASFWDWWFEESPVPPPQPYP